MRLKRLAVLIFTIGAGVALTLGILGSCTTNDVGSRLKQKLPAVFAKS